MKTLQTELEAKRDELSAQQTNGKPDFYANLRRNKKFKKLKNKLCLMDDYLGNHNNMTLEEWLKEYPQYAKQAPHTVEQVKKELQDSIEDPEFQSIDDADDLYDYLHMAKLYASDINDDYEEFIEDYEDEMDDNLDASGSQWSYAKGKRKAKRAAKKVARKARKTARKTKRTVAKAARKTKKAAKKELKVRKKAGEISKKEFKDAKKAVRKIKQTAVKEARKEKRETVKEHGGSTASRIWGAAKKVGLAPVRGAFAILLRLNVWDMAGKMNKLREKADTDPKAKKAWDEKVNVLWKRKFAGKPKSFIKQVTKGAKKKPIIIKFKKKKGADGTTEYYPYIVNDGGQDDIYLNVTDPVSTAIEAAAVAIPAILAFVASLKKDKDLVGDVKMDKDTEDDIIRQGAEGITDAEGNTIVTDAEGNTTITDAKGNVTKMDAVGNIISGGAKFFTPRNIGIGVAMLVLLGGGAYAITQAMKGKK